MTNLYSDHQKSVGFVDKVADRSTLLFDTAAKTSGYTTLA